MHDISRKEGSISNAQIYEACFRKTNITLCNPSHVLYVHKRINCLLLAAPKRLLHNLADGSLNPRKHAVVCENK